MEYNLQEQEAREQMVSFGASLFQRGLSAGSSGNLSIRLGADLVLATPTNSSLGRLNPSSLSLVKMDGTHISGARPSKECDFHLKIYAARPECGAIVHLHSTYATALSCLKIQDEEILKPFTPYFVMNVAPVVRIAYFKPGCAELFNAIAENAPLAKCFLLANHGLITTGTNLEQAINMAEELEETAKLNIILRSHKDEIRYLTKAQIDELSQKNK